ncbi:hypothetical protein CEC48_09455 [Pseudomonas sp. K2I15]|nr:hypothetical protein CEC48_09455 [Pseudomonas sp. K2I15]
MGAGLLAKAVCQSLDRLAESPFSRASPLPQGICGDQAACCSFFRLSMSITNRYFTSPLSMRS